MQLLAFIKEKTAYNQWANQQIINWLKQQASENFDRKVISSFDTINRLMHHLMETEKYYFAILRQEDEQYEQQMTTEKIFEELTEIDDRLIEWLSSKDEDEMSKIITLKRSPFVENYSIATIITHLINHSTYHRGQLVALRHQLGMESAPKTDYYRFIIAQSMAKNQMD